VTRQGGFVDVAGGRLRFEAEGQGPPVVLLHAAVADRRMWAPAVPTIVAAGFRAIWYDLRGFGESTTEDVEFSYRQDLMAVLDALSIRRAAIVGNSRGGTIALDAALEYPERVAGVVHIGAFISGVDGGRTAAERALFAAMEAAHDAGDVGGEVQIDAQLWLDGPTAPGGRVPGTVRAAFVAMDTPICAEGRVLGRPRLLEPPAAERLGDLRIPVLAIVGALDLSAALAAAEQIERQVPRAHRIVLPGVAHMAPMVAPDVVAGLVVDHLAGSAPWA
jgi:pimeloyl-ACP methyl ester carboxylesterase